MGILNKKKNTKPKRFVMQVDNVTAGERRKSEDEKTGKNKKLSFASFFRNFKSVLDRDDRHDRDNVKTRNVHAKSSKVFTIHDRDKDETMTSVLNRYLKDESKINDYGDETGKVNHSDDPKNSDLLSQVKTLLGVEVSAKRKSKDYTLLYIGVFVLLALLIYKNKK